MSLLKCYNELKKGGLGFPFFVGVSPGVGSAPGVVFKSGIVFKSGVATPGVARC